MKTQNKSKDQNEKKQDDNVLVAAAKAIGAAAGTVASAVGVHEEPVHKQAAAAPARGKLAPSHKTRMPRRRKKALHKAGLNAQKKAVA